MTRPPLARAPRRSARLQEPITLVGRSRILRFDTEDGIFGFPYDRLKYFRWENHGKGLDSHALHFFFDTATVSVVGNDLMPFVAELQAQRLGGFRIGQGRRFRITYIGVQLGDSQKRFEARFAA